MIKIITGLVIGIVVLGSSLAYATDLQQTVTTQELQPASAPAGVGKITNTGNIQGLIEMSQQPPQDYQVPTNAIDPTAPGIVKTFTGTECVSQGLNLKQAIDSGGLSLEN